MKYTKKYLSGLPQPLIGIDEVGRGCLAGPVYAAAVIFNSEIDNHLYQDSKKLNELQKNKLSASIQRHHQWAIGISTVQEVDRVNIRQATFLAMRRAVEGLGLKNNTATLLVDGRDTIPNIEGFNQLAIIQGDDQVRLIAAASIVAKVARDKFMSELAQSYKDYGFEKHKGYGTLFHRKQIQKYGPTAWHRQTFAGVKEHLLKFN